jgi:hypothetical protein
LTAVRIFLRGLFRGCLPGEIGREGPLEAAMEMYPHCDTITWLEVV